MPRIILRKPPRPPEHDQLVRRLTQGLKSPGSGLQPLIIEREIGATGSRHVHVIWDEWKRLSEEQRSEIIFEAYAKAEGDKAAEAITLGSGATPEEAVVLGLLPFKVVSTRKRHEARPPMAKYKKVIDAEARNTLLGTDADELRYPRLEDAEEPGSDLRKLCPDRNGQLFKRCLPSIDRCVIAAMSRRDRGPQGPRRSAVVRQRDAADQHAVGLPEGAAG